MTLSFSQVFRKDPLTVRPTAWQFRFFSAAA
jgi:hypothetical protein